MSKPIASRALNINIQSKVKEILQFSNQITILQSKPKPLPLQISPNLINTIEHLKYTAAHNKIVSLSATQINISQRVFVILKKNLVLANKWRNYQISNPITSYDAIINPQLVTYSKFKYKADEECPTFPGLKFKIWVSVMGQFNYFKLPQIFSFDSNSPNNYKHTSQNKTQKKSNTNTNKNSQLVEYNQKMYGFYARVFDHEYRHLEGLILNNSEISLGECYLNDQFKTNPENYEYLNQLKAEQKYFYGQKFKKQMAKQISQHKLTKPSKKSQSQALKKMQTAEQIPEKITPQMKTDLMKSYSQALQKIKSVKQNQKKYMNSQQKQNMSQRQQISQNLHQDQELNLSKRGSQIIQKKVSIGHRSNKKTLNLVNPGKQNTST